VSYVPRALEGPRTQRQALGLLAIVLACAGALVLLPSSTSIILASWFALLTRPWTKKLATRLGGRTTAAAVTTTLVVIGFLGPIVLAVVPVVISSLQLANEVGRSQQWHDAARAVVGNGADASLVNLMRGQIANAWGVVSVVLRTSATALFGIVMFVVSLFAFSAHGEAIVGWMRGHSPLAPRDFDRLASVYRQTGRGLVLGVGASALIQGALAAMTYAVIGIPRALALGMLTSICALIPGFGTMLVWGPVTVILAMGGYPGKAALVAITSLVLISSVDNFLKPILSHKADLKLPSILIFVTMLSGMMAFGPAGLILGPLFVCLAMETLAIAKERQLVGRDDVPAPLAKTAASSAANVDDRRSA